MKWPLDHFVAIVVGIGVHLIVLNPVPINPAGSKTYICTPKSSFHVEVDLDPVVGIVVGVDEHLMVLKPFPMKSAWSKTYISAPKSSFYNAREMSYTLKWTLTYLLALSLVFVNICWF